MEKGPKKEKEAGANNEYIQPYQPRPGESISKTAEGMVTMAKYIGESVRAEFNDIELIATEDTTAEEIIKEFNTEAEKRRKKAKSR